MKKLAVLFLILPLILLCGFKNREKPFVILSSGSIINDNIQRIERTFNSKERINYALITPDGLKYGGVRMQISSQNQKTSNWGFSVIQSKDLYIDTSSKIYKDYIFIQKPGNYIIQFFYLNKKNYPFAHKEFTVI